MLNNDEYVEFMKPKYSSVDITEIELPESDGISDRDDENSHYLMEVNIKSQNYLNHILIFYLT